MKHAAAALFAALFCLSGVASAAPSMDVVLYPSSAQIRAEESLPVKDGEVSFVLPNGAKLNSLMLSLEKGTVANRRTEPVKLDDSEAVAALRASLAEARSRAASVEGEVAAVKSRIALWSRAQTREGTLAELEKLDAAMPGHLKALYVQAAGLEPQLAKAKDAVARLEKELAGFGSATDGVRVVAAVNGVSGTATVRYTCMLSGCGWSPMYRFNAEPEAGLVRFTQQAEIHQSTGQDWKNVRLTLASGNPGGLRPAELPDWLLERREAMARAMAAAPEAVGANADMVVMKAEMPSPRETATFGAWELGTRSVPAGKPTLIDLSQGDWKASFVRLARPGYGDNAAWLMAEAKLPAAVDWPQGRAQFLVDGLPVGFGPFSLVGDTSSMFFGKDSRVRVEMKEDARQSGSSGFVGKRQTRVWKWTIEVANSHTRPVAVRVEDPEPQIGDQRIEVKTTAKPAPVVKEHVATWNLDVPALGKSVINYTVEASAPEDLPFDEGR